MDIKAYLEQQCVKTGIRRRDIPMLLGYRNTAKALRRYDAFVAGNITDEDIVQRIKQCPKLAGSDFELALAHTAHIQRVAERELLFAHELRDRITFKPHLWFEHERSSPTPIIVVAMLGEHRFRCLELTDEIAALPETDYKLFEIRLMLRDLLEQQPRHPVLMGPFGRAIRVLYRDTYDHSTVFDLATLEIIDERFTVPKMGKAALSVRASRKGRGRLRGLA